MKISTKGICSTVRNAMPPWRWLDSIPSNSISPVKKSPMRTTKTTTDLVDGGLALGVFPGRPEGPRALGTLGG